MVITVVTRVFFSTPTGEAIPSYSERDYHMDGHGDWAPIKGTAPVIRMGTLDTQVGLLEVIWHTEV